MKKHGHYCKVCGEYKANEKFSGKGHAAHVCKSCASLPPEKQAEQMTINRLLNLPWRLSKEQISWLKNRMKDKRREVRALAKEQYEMRFPPKRLEDIEDNFDFLDEDDLIEYRDVKQGSNEIKFVKPWVLPPVLYIHNRAWRKVYQLGKIFLCPPFCFPSFFYRYT